MSNNQPMAEKFETLKKAKPYIAKCEEDFNQLIQEQAGTGLTKEFSQELPAFLNELMKNHYVRAEHLIDAERIKKAFLDIAKHGLSLVKESGMMFAYVTMSDQGFHIFSSYNGLIRLAVLSDSIKVTTASTVHVNDDKFRVFTREDGTQAIEHEYGLATLREGRGDIVGAFCATEFSTGVKTSSIVDLNEIYQIRAMADSTFWDNFFMQMACKTAVRKEAKNWVRFGTNTRLLAGLLDHEQNLSSTEFPNNPVNKKAEAKKQHAQPEKKAVNDEEPEAPRKRRSMSALRKQA